MTQKFGNFQQLEKEKEVEFVALLKEYAKVKEEVSSIIEESKELPNKHKMGNPFVTEEE
jgi:hypothetical protein